MRHDIWSTGRRRGSGEPGRSSESIGFSSSVEGLMTTVLCRFKVADYDRFRPGYDHAVQVTPGLLCSRPGSAGRRTIHNSCSSRRRSCLERRPRQPLRALRHGMRWWPMVSMCRLSGSTTSTRSAPSGLPDASDPVRQRAPEHPAELVQNRPELGPRRPQPPHEALDVGPGRRQLGVRADQSVGERRDRHLCVAAMPGSARTRMRT